MYKVKYGGKNGQEVNLVESPDLVAVRTVGKKDLESVKLSSRSRGVMSTTEEVETFPEAGVTVIKMKAPTQKAALAMRDATRTALKTEEDIKFAGRVLEDESTGNFMLYTENIFVKFKDDVDEKTCLEVIKKYKLEVKDKLVFAPNSYFLKATEGTGLKIFELAEKMLAEKTVENCHPELVQQRRFRAAVMVNSNQWHLRPTVVGGKKVEAHANVEAAWAMAKGEGITIAIVDDGVDTNHPEFAGKIVAPRDVTVGDNDGNPKDPDDAHGTACAGVACASGLEVAGVAPRAKLMPIRCRSGLGSMAEANAFVWAADNGADVISCSWGPTDGEWWNPADKMHKMVTALPDSTRLAMEYALTKGRKGRGCIICFAAGNGNEKADNDGYASYPKVIAVAACNDMGKRSVYSDFGQNVWCAFPSGDFEYEPFKHPAPLTEGIFTTDRMGVAGYETTNYTGGFGGTSSACPGVAGVIALMLEVNPNLNWADAKEIIRRSCQKIDPAGGKYSPEGHSIYYGYGKLDAALAVKNAKNYVRKGEQKADGAQPTTPSGPSAAGVFRFSKVGDIPAADGQTVGNFTPAQRLLGFSLSIPNKPAGLTIKVKANVKGQISEAEEGKYVGSPDSKNRVIGFAAELSGPAAKDFSIQYSAQIEKAAKPSTASDGAFCGTSKKTGKAILAVSVKLVKKG